VSSQVVFNEQPYKLPSSKLSFVHHKLPDIVYQSIDDYDASIMNTQYSLKLYSEDYINSLSL
jgi:hypothetical protein